MVYLSVMRGKKVTAMAEQFRYLGDSSRCALLLALKKEQGGLYVHEVAEILHVTHSAASHQLGSLEIRGIVEGVREGQMVRYSLSNTHPAKQALRLIRASL